MKDNNCDLLTCKETAAILIYIWIKTVNMTYVIRNSEKKLVKSELIAHYTRHAEDIAVIWDGPRLHLK